MILIRKTKEAFGWMSNMSAHPVEFDGKTFRTAEALFQSLRFSDEEIIEKIRSQKSPMAAKMVAKANSDKMVISPGSAEDLQNMMTCLTLKVDQHPEMRKQLLLTADEEIVEDCTNRQRGSGLFWGKALRDGEWHGDNRLGKSWMQLREELETIKWVEEWDTTASLPPAEL